MNLIDNFNRKHDYLRVSLTDRCNLSCIYCPSYVESRFNKKTNYNNIINIIKLLSEVGISKVRFTGGEPLLCENIGDIISQTKKIKNIKEVCITTNGVLLKKWIFYLKSSGLDRINVSLDSLNPKRFKSITKSDKFYDVLDGIYMAISYGFKLKINVVLLKDLSLEEVDLFIRFAIDNCVEVRFIELMPFCNSGFMNREFVSSNVIEQYLRSRYGYYQYQVDGVSKKYLIDNNSSIGFISPISCPFCNTCNRLRLSSQSILYRCLFDNKGLDLNKFVGKIDDKLIIREINNYLLNKKIKHNINNISSTFSTNSMRFIGG